MKEKISVSAEHEIMDELVLIMTKHNVSVEPRENIIKASSKPPTRHSETFFGNVRDIALGILGLLKIRHDLEINFEVGNKIEVITRQDSTDKIEKTISSQKVFRFWVSNKLK